MYNNYYQPQNQYVPPRTTFLKGRQVTSLDEVRAQTVDFDGSIFYFPDVANNLIYTKQINMDGTADIKMYRMCEIPKEEKVEYVTKKEFEEFAAALSKREVETAQPQTKIIKEQEKQSYEF